MISFCESCKKYPNCMYSSYKYLACKDYVADNESGNWYFIVPEGQGVNCMVYDHNKIVEKKQTDTDNIIVFKDIDSANCFVKINKLDHHSIKRLIINPKYYTETLSKHDPQCNLIINGYCPGTRQCANKECKMRDR